MSGKEGKVVSGNDGSESRRNDGREKRRKRIKGRSNVVVLLSKGG